MTLPELARLWWNHPLQHAVIVKNIRKEERRCMSGEVKSGWPT